MESEQIKEEKRNPTSMIKFLKKLPKNTPDDYGTLIMELTKYNPEERIPLTIARLELENLFDENVLWIDLDPDDDDSETPTPDTDSSSITIETPPTSTGELGPVGKKSADSKNPINPTKDRESDSSTSANKRICDHDINDSPTSIDPPNLIFQRNRLDENYLEIEETNRVTEIKKKVYTIFGLWEKLVDTTIIHRLEALCRAEGLRSRDLLNIFEENPFESPNYYFAIGFFNEHGFGKFEDPKAAFENYSKARDARGKVYLGWCYYKGMGTQKDPQKAFEAFQSAADQGCASAQNNVGWCYDIGFGVHSDPVKAFECFRASGEMGYATAQCRVGLCYEYGKGTAKDLEKALEWYNRAAENGLESSKKRANEISKMIAGGRRRNFLVCSLS
ncbi:1857_t:CDS:2 [Acaulospora colombiana]|uniref:1857_t:CDS:1 n=1 Tax=Acaulospora colombiana TaxID=27376 RepID=A0ACA9KJ96_9GLOM|nr:1857_t:CDS:2 [Acaulospora colombiana]